MRSDLVISNATIEHVGSFENQLKMVKNIILLSKKYFVITTLNIRLSAPGTDCCIFNDAI